ncbi:hypothetical protein QTO17_01115 [Vibrio owensii]
MKNNDRAKAKKALLSSFESTYPMTIVMDEADSRPEEVALTKTQLFDLFTQHEVVDDKSTTAFIPGTFTNLKSRSAEDVRQISMIVYDIDCKNTYYRLCDLKEKLSSITCIVHSTYSATFEHPRWRVIILLDKPVEPEQFDNVYRGIAKKLDLEFDQTCTNVNRLFYLPSVSSHNDFIYSWTNEGSLISAKPFYGKASKKKVTKRTTTAKTSLTHSLNRGYVSCSSVDFEQAAKNPVESSGEICGFPVPKALKAPFSQSDFNDLLSYPGTWLQAAKHLGFPVERISATNPYSKSFSSVIPGVEDKKPSCSIALLTSNNRTRVVYQAFNETHDIEGASGPVKIDLARIYAMMHCGRRIERDAFPAGTHKVWLTRLLIASGMIIPEIIEDLPELPEEAKSAERLYVGFRDLLMCKRAFMEQKSDATAFSLTFACYWCRIGNRNTVKKYSQALLDANVLRFVDRIDLPRGGSIPLMMPAGQSASVYRIKQREASKGKERKVVTQSREDKSPAQQTQTTTVTKRTTFTPDITYIESLQKPPTTEEQGYAELPPYLEDTIFSDSTNIVQPEIGQGRGLDSVHVEPDNPCGSIERLVKVVRAHSNKQVSLELLLAESKLPVDEELISVLPLVKRYVSDYESGYSRLLTYKEKGFGT